MTKGLFVPLLAYIPMADTMPSVTVAGAVCAILAVSPAASAADAPAADPPAADRQTIVVTPQHRFDEWEEMKVHTELFHKLKERFDPDPRTISKATQLLDDVLDQRPTGQKEPEAFRATRDAQDTSAQP